MSAPVSPPAALEETETGMIGRDNTRATEWFPVLACAQSQTIIAFPGAWLCLLKILFGMTRG